MKANMFKKVSTAVIPLGLAAGASMAQAQLVNGAIGSARSSARSNTRASTGAVAKLFRESFMNVLCRMVLTLATIGFAGGAAAAPSVVIVGSVDPQSKQVTVFEGLLSRQFADGGPVLRIYGGYSARSKKHHLVRAGKTINGACMTEVFQLARLSGNRLALAVPTTGQAWNPNRLQQLGVTFDCTSSSCFICTPDHGIPEFGEEPGCTCGTPTDSDPYPDDGILTGTCSAARPGSGSYGYDALVTLGS